MVMDKFSKKKRSSIMRSIKSEHTKPEMIVRSGLHKNGYGFRLHRKDLPGTPDIVMAKYGIAIFVNGCFWHQHGCDRTSVPKTHKKFWSDKFDKNVARDARNHAKLKEMGWEVLVIWECDILKDIDEEISRIAEVAERRSREKFSVRYAKKTQRVTAKKRKKSSRR